MLSSFRCFGDNARSLREDEHIANHEFMKEEFVAGIHEPHVQCPFQYEDRLTGSWMGMGRYRTSGSHVYAAHR
jgi:hypothetical protein